METIRTGYGEKKVGTCGSCGMGIILPLEAKNGNGTCTDCGGKDKVYGVHVKNMKGSYFRKTPVYKGQVLPNRHFNLK